MNQHFADEEFLMGRQGQRSDAMSKVQEGMNVYAELGFKDADQMLVKAQLVVKITEILRERG